MDVAGRAGDGAGNSEGELSRINSEHGMTAAQHAWFSTPSVNLKRASLLSRALRIQEEDPMSLTRPCCLLSVIFVFAFSRPGYSQGPAQSFEVASIHPSVPQEAGRVSTRLSIDANRFLYTNVSLLDLISYAYTVSSQLVFGPSRLATERFDINAKIPEGSGPRQSLNQMVATLLATRFGLIVHREKRKLPCLILTVDKRGAKLQSVDGTGGLSAGNNNKAHLAYLSGRLSISQLSKYFGDQLGRPIIDDTKLSGAYVVNLQWVPDVGDSPELAANRPAGPSLTGALKDQAGLVLKPARANIEVIIVDAISEYPTEN